MEPKALLNADYLDIIFDNRNKIYGGYELRRNYNRRLKKAAGFVVLGVAAVLSFSFIAAHRAATVTKPHITPTVITDVNIEKPPVVPKGIPPVTPPPPAPRLNTHLFTVPDIVEDTKAPDDKLMTPNKCLHDAQPGPGDITGDSLDITPVIGTGKKTGIVTTAENTDKPRIWVEQMPQFIGDMNAYISGHLHYPELARSAGIDGKVLVEFVVNEDGSVSNAKIVTSIGGGCDEEALRMVSRMPHWKPGKQNGMPVKVLFTLPIRFVLN